DGGGQGAPRGYGGPPPRATQRAPARAYRRGPPDWLAPGRRHPHRDDLLLARNRAVGLRVDPGARLRDSAGGEPFHRGRRRHREPAHGPPVRDHRPAHQVRLMAVSAATVERLAVVSASGHSPTAAAWRRLLSSPVARAGLLIVCAFVLIATLT